MVCNQLGYPGADHFYSYGDGSTDPILLTNIECGGYETNLGECAHSDWYADNCVHTEDVGIVCNKQPSKFEDANSTKKNSIVEIATASSCVCIENVAGLRRPRGPLVILGFCFLGVSSFVFSSSRGERVIGYFDLALYSQQCQSFDTNLDPAQPYN